MSAWSELPVALLGASEWLRGEPRQVLLVALALLPVLAALWSGARRRRALGVLASPRHLRRLVPELGPRGLDGPALVRWLRRRAWTRGLLGGLAALLMAVAYLGPVRGHALVPVSTREIDVAVVLDTSRSMWAEDVSPNRLERAKREIGALFDAMRGERVALIAFAGMARSVAPLTRDVDTARYFLERVSPADNRKGGTDIGAALRLALERFEDGRGSTQAIVLVTDGEDLTGEGLEAARAAKERGIRVHVLGMGTETGAKIPDGDGGFVVDPTADGGPEEVVTRLEAGTLRAIAEASGGIYLGAKGRVLPLEELYERAIASIGDREVIDGKERVPMDRYQWPLAVALALALAELALTDARRRERVSAEPEREA